MFCIVIGQNKTEKSFSSIWDFCPNSPSNLNSPNGPNGPKGSNGPNGPNGPNSPNGPNGPNYPISLNPWQDNTIRQQDDNGSG